MKEQNSMQIDLPGRSNNEGIARAAVACFVSQLDPTLDELGDIKTAVSEAVTNCIVHAYPDKIGKIRIKCKIYEGNLFELSVKDWGCGIEDIKKAVEPMFTTGGDDRSGMGFTIMESFMDKLSVRSGVGKGTTVTMRRRIIPRIGGK